ncbi:MAG: radical SAM protein [Bacteriovoracaceae bacterium]|jgi:wyosine [tRNA(Phe)-imidazoG37] synthetase (radical SAM superfamily)|nr:radical SAM protein [Bacteriovoracaceae bacterium]
MSTNTFENINKKTVYGPVKSWRFGQSLGIDPLFQTSICSFDCIYCQLGKIQNLTIKRDVYVKTEQVLEDYREVIASNTIVDVITYSGSGEPTLALNLDEMIKGIGKLSPTIPQNILTNATTLHLPEVRKTLLSLDKVIVKLDGPTEQLMKTVNRPAEGVSFESIIEGIREFRKIYNGALEVQCMLMPLLEKDFEQFFEIMKSFNPNLVQFNTPSRPYPSSWHRENRGNHELIFDYKVNWLKELDKTDFEAMSKVFSEQTGLKVLIK